MPRPKPTRDDCIARFRSKIVEKPDGCHEWTAGKLKAGYGLFYFMGRLRLVHRIAWEIANGEIPKGFDVHHACRNKACVNVAHLALLTDLQHMWADHLAGAVNALKTHCPRGHPYDAENTGHSGGRRHCRACHRIRFHERKAKAQSVGARKTG